MLANFFNSAELRKEFELNFSYRASTLYQSGLKRRTKLDFSIYPLHSPEFSNPGFLPQKMPLFSKRVVMFFLRLIGTVPLLIYQVWILQRLFRKIKPDLVHINNGGYPAALSARAAVIAARFAGVDKIIMVVNNLAVDYRRFSRWWEYPLDRLIAHEVTRFLTGSEFAANQLKAVLRLPPYKIQSIHNGISIRHTSESIIEVRKRLRLENFNGVIFGVVALMEQRKGHQVLLEALIYLLKTALIPKGCFKFLLEGDGSLRKKLEQYVIDNGLSDYCIFVGVEPNVMNFMTLLDVLILPSISDEDFPNVILEAMALEKPVIASRIAGTSEQLVDGETGILVAPRDSIELAEAILRLLLNQSLRQKMGECGRNRFLQHFTAVVAVRKYLSLYQSIITE